jgi:hypothetical protein
VQVVFARGVRGDVCLSISRSTLAARLFLLGAAGQSCVLCFSMARALVDCSAGATANQENLMLLIAALPMIFFLLVLAWGFGLSRSCRPWFGDEAGMSTT